MGFIFCSLLLFIVVLGTFELFGLFGDMTCSLSSHIPVFRCMLRQKEKRCI